MYCCLKLIAWVVALVVATALPAEAGQTTDTFKVGIKISTICRIVAADLDFGTTTAVTGTESVTSNISVWCNSGVPYSLSFNPTGRVANFNGTLVGQTPGNPGTIPFRVRRTGSSGTGRGHRAANVRNFPMTATLTATPNLWVDTYKRTVTIYLNY
jgi:spore coat protein U-like protein